MCCMCVNRVARGGSSAFWRGKGRMSAMTASSSFKGSRDYYNKLGHKNTQVSNFLERAGRVPLVFRRDGGA